MKEMIQKRCAEAWMSFKKHEETNKIMNIPNEDDPQYSGLRMRWVTLDDLRKDLGIDRLEEK
jgi:hypothetical protein